MTGIPNSFSKFQTSTKQRRDKSPLLNEEEEITEDQLLDEIFHPNVAKEERVESTTTQMPSYFDDEPPNMGLGLDSQEDDSLLLVADEAPSRSCNSSSSSSSSLSSYSSKFSSLSRQITSSKVETPKNVPRKRMRALYDEDDESSFSCSSSFSRTKSDDKKPAGEVDLEDSLADLLHSPSKSNTFSQGSAPSSTSSSSSSSSSSQSSLSQTLKKHQQPLSSSSTILQQKYVVPSPPSSQQAAHTVDDGEHTPPSSPPRAFRNKLFSTPTGNTPPGTSFSSSSSSSSSSSTTQQKTQPTSNGSSSFTKKPTTSGTTNSFTPLSAPSSSSYSDATIPRSSSTYKVYSSSAAHSRRYHFEDRIRELQERKSELELQIQGLLEESGQVESEIVALQKQMAIDEADTVLERRDGALGDHNSVNRVCNPRWSSFEFPWTRQIEDTKSRRFGISSAWRVNQREVINATLSGRDSFVVMPTGGGKSLCYQIPALVDEGITVVVSPLLSLIQDQVYNINMSLSAQRKANKVAAMITSNVPPTEVTKIYDEMLSGTSTLKLVYVTPEQVVKGKRLLSKLEKLYEQKRLSRIVIDEAHCCSQVRTQSPHLPYR
jgi:hypothetical protein